MMGYERGVQVVEEQKEGKLRLFHEAKNSLLECERAEGEREVPQNQKSTP